MTMLNVMSGTWPLTCRCEDIESPTLNRELIELMATSDQATRIGIEFMIKLDLSTLKVSDRRFNVA
jgi:hypothetical protein